jgi:hypothetical protein
MNTTEIRDANDIKSIEALGYGDFMPYENVYDALQNTANEHGQRSALTYIQDATNTALSQT